MVVPERGGRKSVWVARGDDPDPDTPREPRQEPVDDGLIRDVRVDDVDAVGGCRDPALARRARSGRWPVPGTFHRTVPASTRRRRVGTVRGSSEGTAIEARPRQPAAPVAPAGHEHQLELRDDRSGHPAHDVVEALVRVVVLDPAAADVADPAVDDGHLAMVEMERSAGRRAARRCPGSSLRGSERRRGRRLRRRAARRSRNRPGSRSRPRCRWRRPAAGRRRPAATSGHEHVPEGRPDVARLVAVDQEVDVVAGRPRCPRSSAGSSVRPWSSGSTLVAAAGAKPSPGPDGGGAPPGAGPPPGPVPRSRRPDRRGSAARAGVRPTGVARARPPSPRQDRR